MNAVAETRSASKQMRYDLAEVLLFDGSPPNRSTTRTALFMVGFRQVMATSDMDELLSTVRVKPFDMFVADITDDAERICDLVQAIRAGRLGLNPFMHIILMAWQLRDDLVKRALNCGADDLVARPYSVGFFQARIKTLTEARKGFVVTSEYLGPDRRRDSARPNSASLFEVPNTLKMKAVGGAHYGRKERDSELLSAIRMMQSKLTEERSRRHVFQLSLLAHFIREAMSSSKSLTKDLSRIESVAKELTFGIEASGSDQVMKLFHPLKQAVAGAMAGDNVAANVDMIEQMAKTLYVTLSPGKTEEDLKAELDQAIAVIKSRGRKD